MKSFVAFGALCAIIASASAASLYRKFKFCVTVEKFCALECDLKKVIYIFFITSECVNVSFSSRKSRIQLCNFLIYLLNFISIDEDGAKHVRLARSPTGFIQPGYGGGGFGGSQSTSSSNAQSSSSSQNGIFTECFFVFVIFFQEVIVQKLNQS